MGVAGWGLVQLALKANMQRMKLGRGQVCGYGGPSMGRCRGGVGRIGGHGRMTA